MKHILTVFVAMAMSTTYACDACGCSGSLGNMGLGLQVQGNRTSFSFLHSYKHYATTYQGLYGRPDTYSQEYYLKGDLSASVRLSKRFQARFSLPLNYNLQKSSENGNKTIVGLGDAQLGFHYFVIDSMFNNKTIFRWSAGAGLKLPTGKFTDPENEDLMLYPGTGSLDYTISSSFAMRSGKFGLSNESSYMLRTANKYEYHPGNTLFSQLLGIFIVNRFSVGTGASIATNGKAKLNNEPFAHTNAQALLIQSATVLSYSKNNLSLQIGLNIPIYQKLGEEQSKQREAISFGIYYLLNKTK